MNIKFDTIWIADESTHVSGVTLDGQQLVQESDLLRATYAEFKARKNRRRSISFLTARTFSTIKAAEAHLFQHYEALANQGTLLFRIGLVSETQQDLTFANAVLESVQHQPPVGLAVLTRYQFRAGAVAGLVNTPPEDDFTSGTFAIPDDAETVVVTGLGLASVPAQVLLTVRGPADGVTLAASVQDDTVTIDGWTAWFNGKTDASTYKLDWLVLF